MAYHFTYIKFIYSSYSFKYNYNQYKYIHTTLTDHLFNNLLIDFINNDICPIPHRNSDGGGNRYCERLPISEQHALGGGPEGSSRLAPPGIKVPTSWDNIDIVDSSGSHKLSELINSNEFIE